MIKLKVEYEKILGPNCIWDKRKETHILQP